MKFAELAVVFRPLFNRHWKKVVGLFGRLRRLSFAVRVLQSTEVPLLWGSVEALNHILNGTILKYKVLKCMTAPVRWSCGVYIRKLRQETVLSSQTIYVISFFQFPISYVDTTKFQGLLKSRTLGDVP